MNDVLSNAQLEAEARRIVAEHRAVVRPISVSKKWKRRKGVMCEMCATACTETSWRYTQWKCPRCGSYVRKINGNPLLHGFLLPDLKIEILIHLLAEGLGVRASSRVLRIHTSTILKIYRLTGIICRDFLQKRLSEIPASDVEVDEVWTYVFKKDFTKRECEKKNHKIGSAWIYIGLDRATKMILAHHAGRRTTDDACEFMKKLRAATTGHMTVYTDGFQPYPTAVYSAFLYDNDLSALPDFIDKPAVVVRNNGTVGMLHETDAVNYNPACTNQVEKFNSTLRSGLKRMARQTTGQSKSWTALEDALAVFLAYYNFCKVHSSLDVKDETGNVVHQTPAMAAGLSDHPWSIRDLIIEAQRFREDYYTKQSEVRPQSEAVEMRA